MLTLHYERRHKVLAIRIAGVLSSEDIAEHDRLVLHFLAGRQGVRGLYDFSRVEVLAVPVSKIDQRGQRPPIIDEMRVVVAPPGTAGRDFVHTITAQLQAAGHREPVIVESLAEAHRLLGIEDPQFEPVELRAD